SPETSLRSVLPQAHDVGEAKSRYDHNQTCAHANQHMGANAGRPQQALAFKANEAPEPPIREHMTSLRSNQILCITFRHFERSVSKVAPQNFGKHPSSGWEPGRCTMGNEKPCLPRLRSAFLGNVYSTRAWPTSSSRPARLVSHCGACYTIVDRQFAAS